MISKEIQNWLAALGLHIDLAIDSSCLAYFWHNGEKVYICDCIDIFV